MPFAQDATLDGVRYVQAPLATPAERARRMPSLVVGDDPVLPLKLYDGDAGDDNDGASGGAATEQSDAGGEGSGGEGGGGEGGGRARGGFVRRMHAAWSDHYDNAPRTPADTFPAPWVLNYYTRRAPSRVSLAVGGFGGSVQPAAQQSNATLNASQTGYGSGVLWQ